MIHEFFLKALGIGSQWQITHASMSGDESRLDLYLVYVGKAPVCCSECGSPLLETSPSTQEWHHDDFFRISTYIHADIPSKSCPSCRSPFVPELPWAREWSLFHRHDREQTSELPRHAPDRE